MSERSFGGYAYQQRLGSGTFGEQYRAVSGAGSEARIVHVDPRLAGRPAFARALVRFGERNAPLAHPNAVAVRQVGKSGEHLVVVTDPVAGGVSVRSLLARGPVPAALALAIGLGVAEGLARAHEVRIAHGAIHPRSVLIDASGAVRLDDFGLAWALVETALAEDQTTLLQELRGYLAPEMAFGGSATPVADVYAAGALLFELFEGAPPPGELDAPPRVGEVIERALAIDPGERLALGHELRDLLSDAIEADGCEVASREELARFVSDRMAEVEDALHAETDDLVAVLDPVPPAELEAARSNRVSDLLAQLEEDDELDLPPAPAVPPPSPPRSARHAVPPRPSAPHAVPPRPSAPHAVPPRPSAPHAIPPRPSAPHAIPPRPTPARPSQQVAVQAGMDEATPLPEPAPPRPGSVTRHLAVGDEELTRVRQEKRQSRELALAAEDEATRVTPRRPRAIVWVGVTAFAVAAVAAVVYTQLDGGRREAEEREAELARQEALARHKAAQPNPVELTVTSDEPDAAVWLLLGRTPLQSLPLSSGMVHELRLEHEGYLPLDVRVTGYQWKEQGGVLTAEVSAEMVQGTPARPVPAFAAAPPAEPPAGPRGRGVIRVVSSPAGAQVWLLIGFTPRATISGLEGGRDYELKLLKEGFRPGSAAVRAAEWYLSGPGGPMLTSLTREVKLTRAEPPPQPAKPSKQRGRAGRARKNK